MQERETNCHGFYIPLTKVEINPVLGKAPKKYATRFYQLKMGHRVIAIYLAKIKKIESPECWWYREKFQIVEHLYTQCRRWRRERKKRVKELGKERVIWQARLERKWLVDLLASEKVVTPLLGFLKATDVGAREGAREREVEQGQINDQADEDLLG